MNNVFNWYKILASKWVCNMQVLLHWCVVQDRLFRALKTSSINWLNRDLWSGEAICVEHLTARVFVEKGGSCSVIVKMHEITRTSIIFQEYLIL